MMSIIASIELILIGFYIFIYFNATLGKITDKVATERRWFGKHSREDVLWHVIGMWSVGWHENLTVVDLSIDEHSEYDRENIENSTYDT